MSAWAKVFPLLDDGMVVRYHEEATDEEKARLEELFEVARVYRRRTDVEVYRRDAEVAEGRGGTRRFFK